MNEYLVDSTDWGLELEELCDGRDRRDEGRTYVYGTSTLTSTLAVRS